MNRLDGWYLNDHVSQYAPTAQPVTRRYGCTWTSTRNAADAATKGKIDRTPDQVHALVRNSEEVNPKTLGWAVPDAALALARMGLASEDVTGQGWGAVERAHAAGYYVVFQGDSDRFGDNTCSGDFDGDHCIGAHPATRNTPDGVEWWIDDPICPTGRWENRAVLSSYARKLAAGVRALVVKPAVDRTLIAHVPPGRYYRHWVVPIDEAPGRKIKASRRYTTAHGFTVPVTRKIPVQRRTIEENVLLVKIETPEGHDLHDVWIGANYVRE